MSITNHCRSRASRTMAKRSVLVVICSTMLMASVANSSAAWYQQQHQQQQQQQQEESLRGALNALTRKQRSLNAVESSGRQAQQHRDDYYYDYRPERLPTQSAARNSQASLQQVAASRDSLNVAVDGGDSTRLNLVPSESEAGQLETIGNGYQNLQNNKQFNRALLYYLQNDQKRQEPIQSVFRERTNSMKRAKGNALISRDDRLSSKELARILQEEQFNPHGRFDEGRSSSQRDDEYLKTLAVLLDKYSKHTDDDDDSYDNEAITNNGKEQLLDLNEILNDDEREDPGEQDPRYTRVRIDRRNVNARFPLFDSRDYFKDSNKRFPVSKRSAANDDNDESQTTDPKVSKELSSLFGSTSPITESTIARLNRTGAAGSDRDLHRHDHRHQEHEHDLQSGHEHEHDHSVHGSHDHHETDKPNNNNNNNNNKNSTMRNERTITLQKKSVDWSQYFGLDKRKKKTAYLAKPGTRDEDDRYLLQKYYELMAENLKPEIGAYNAGRSGTAAMKRDKSAIGRQNESTRPKEEMNKVASEEAITQIGSPSTAQDDRSDRKEDDVEQARKDEMLDRMYTLYNLDKLRQALSELSVESAKARQADRQRQQQQQQQQQDDDDNDDDNSNRPVITSRRSQSDESKRNHNDRLRQDDELDFLDSAGIDENDIPEDNCYTLMGIVDRRCKASEALIGDFRQTLREPCLSYHVCESCERANCLDRFYLEAAEICESREDSDDATRAVIAAGSRKRVNNCLEAALQLTRYPPMIDNDNKVLCRRSRGDSDNNCLARYNDYHRKRLRAEILAPAAASNKLLRNDNERISFNKRLSNHR